MNHHLPLETAQHWITPLIATPSPPTAAQLSTLAHSFGWKTTEFPGIYIHETIAGSSIIRAPFDEKDDQLFRLSFNLADNPSNDLKGNIKIADSYIEYIKEGTRLWGEPSDFKTNTTGTIWHLQPRAFIEIYTYPDTITFSLETTDPNNPMVCHRFCGQ